MSQPSDGDNLWCRRYRPARDAAARLVCLPHAGGSAPFFLPVAAALSPGVDVVAIQYPGRQDRRAERPISDMAVLADRLPGGRDLQLRSGHHGQLPDLRPTGDNDPKTTVDEANSWIRHTSGAFDLQVFPGGHFFLTDQADQVIKILDRHFQADRTRSMA